MNFIEQIFFIGNNIFLKFVSVIWLSKRQKAHFSVLIYTRNRCAQRLRPLIRNMMTSTNGNIFRATGPLCGEFTGHRWIPRQRPGTRSFNVSLICARINNHVNNREAGDLRRHGAHYDVTVMSISPMLKVHHGGTIYNNPLYLPCYNEIRLSNIVINDICIPVTQTKSATVHRRSSWGHRDRFSVSSCHKIFVTLMSQKSPYIHPGLFYDQSSCCLISSINILLAQRRLLFIRLCLFPK